MHIDINPHDTIVIRPQSRTNPERRNGGADERPACHSLDRMLQLLSAANIRLSLFSFESLPGAVATTKLLSAVETVVDDTGVAFEMDDGRIGALVYGWRPQNADDNWVEDRTLTRLDWAFGGPFASGELVDIYAVHRWSSEIAEERDLLAALSFGAPLRRVGHFSLA